MKIIFSLIILAAVTATATLTRADEIDKRFTQARTYLNSNQLNITATAEQAFTQDSFLVVGEGYGKKDAVKGQKRLTAITAAKVAAQRRLAELLEGVALVSETTVKESGLASDIIKTAVTGFIKGAEVVVQEWNEQDETALVILKAGIKGPKGFGELLYSKMMTEPAIRKELAKPPYTPPPTPHLPPVPEPALSNYDGLVIDAADYKFKPALINRIFAAGGEILYDPAKIHHRILIEYGCGEYASTVEKARAALGKRGVKNPLVLKAARSLNASDIEVSKEIAEKIYLADQSSGFIADARVAFVLK